MSSIAINIEVHTYLPISAFNSFHIYQEVELLGSYTNCLIFLETMFITAAAPLPFHNTQMFQFLLILVKT